MLGINEEMSSSDCCFMKTVEECFSQTPTHESVTVPLLKIVPGTSYGNQVAFRTGEGTLCVSTKELRTAPGTHNVSSTRTSDKGLEQYQEQCASSM